MAYQLYQNAFRSTNNEADSEIGIRKYEPTHTNLDYCPQNIKPDLEDSLEEIRYIPELYNIIIMGCHVLVLFAIVHCLVIVHVVISVAVLSSYCYCHSGGCLGIVLIIV